MWYLRSMKGAQFQLWLLAKAYRKQLANAEPPHEPPLCLPVRTCDRTHSRNCNFNDKIGAAAGRVFAKAGHLKEKAEQVKPDGSLDIRCPYKIPEVSWNRPKSGRSRREEHKKAKDDGFFAAFSLNNEAGRINESSTTVAGRVKQPTKMGSVRKQTVETLKHGGKAEGPGAKALLSVPCNVRIEGPHPKPPAVIAREAMRISMRSPTLLDPTFKPPAYCRARQQPTDMKRPTALGIQLKRHRDLDVLPLVSSRSPEKEPKGSGHQCPNDADVKAKPEGSVEQTNQWHQHTGMKESNTECVWAK
ncbi:hypothetical protein B0H10DRAFT_1945514 [Mycena sp. CBHHK59/15]|nr:hypothetical protein B0H10DRAFT_1945514 [Mycena sp. CBHHK59/15]